MATTLRTAIVSHHLRAELAAHGITAHHTTDRAATAKRPLARIMVRVPPWR
ncbi:hypothetical protein ACFWIB_33320 [Streptomyces sp. NPDC127051]|uniref:hypothetical protein n=1 Tax=Streptomyces sp. NPDC127051 TaxID=3347119 RepID=UPI003656F9DD